MSLNWNVSEVENFEKACFVTEVRNGEEGEYLTPKAEALVWKTMTIGLPSITRENAEEFLARCMMWERALGVSCYKMESVDGKLRKIDDPITFEDVIKHVGLYTNASRMTQAQFHKHFAECLRRDANWVARSQREAYEDKEQGEGNGSD